MPSKTLATPAQLAAAGLVPLTEVAAITRVASAFAVSITPQMFGLMDAQDPGDPLKAQFVPSLAEMDWTEEEMADPIGDEPYSPRPGIVHRYPDRVLLKPINACAVYCRFCFRRERVGPDARMLDAVALEGALDYIESNPDIWEVIVTGGDPLILAPRRLKSMMSRLAAIDHVGVVRFHTRVPVVRPELVSDALLRALKIDKAVYVVLHVNHVRELAVQARAACARLIDSGFPMLSQTVLLNGVNADSATLTALFRALVETRVKPYYLHHGDLARGTRHFRTSIAEGQALMRTLRGHVSGLCQPDYVLDIPGGYGKVPIGPGYVAPAGDGGYAVTDRFGRAHPYRDVTGCSAQIDARD